MDQHNGEILAQPLSTPGAVFRINPFVLDDPGGFFVGGLNLRVAYFGQHQDLGAGPSPSPLSASGPF